MTGRFYLRHDPYIQFGCSVYHGFNHDFETEHLAVLTRNDFGCSIYAIDKENVEESLKSIQRLFDDYPEYNPRILGVYQCLNIPLPKSNSSN